ncbi:MAG: hypothetical protein IJD48_00205 [Clostridia bacterium]|nr:hypothetical protein [Clostridia bacterium]
MSQIKDRYNDYGKYKLTALEDYNNATQNKLKPGLTPVYEDNLGEAYSTLYVQKNSKPEAPGVFLDSGYSPDDLVGSGSYEICFKNNGVFYCVTARILHSSNTHTETFSGYSIKDGEATPVDFTPEEAESLYKTYRPVLNNMYKQHKENQTKKDRKDKIPVFSQNYRHGTDIIFRGSPKQLFQFVKLETEGRMAVGLPIHKQSFNTVSLKCNDLQTTSLLFKHHERVTSTGMEQNFLAAEFSCYRSNNPDAVITLLTNATKDDLFIFAVVASPELKGNQDIQDAFFERLETLHLKEQVVAGHSGKNLSKSHDAETSALTEFFGYFQNTQVVQDEHYHQATHLTENDDMHSKYEALSKYIEERSYESKIESSKFSSFEVTATLNNAETQDNGASQDATTKEETILKPAPQDTTNQDDAPQE